MFDMLARVRGEHDRGEHDDDGTLELVHRISAPQPIR
jgi:hypothetical protein